MGAAALRSASEAAIDALLAFDQWHYTLDTEPAVVVLDTRMHRWRRTQKTHRPSGLMDWETLIDMQNVLTGRESAIIVSAAPVFGVKLIENIQRIFTFFGKPLMVDDAAGMKTLYSKVEALVKEMGLEQGDAKKESMVLEAEYEIQKLQEEVAKNKA